MICKQRLLTPGPTPLYPKALYAMLGADVHHRTEDFRRIYRALLSDLKEVMGTRQDVLVLVCSGTGAMEASVTNCFSPGDRVIVCSAGRFGERWQEIARAYGLNVAMVEAPYGKAVAPEAVEKALAAYPGAKGVLVQAVESSTGVAHDVRSMGLAVKKTSALFIVDAITGLGTMPLSIDDWGLDIVIGGSQKSFMVPPGIAFLSISEKASNALETAALRFQSQQRAPDGGEGRVELDAGDCAAVGVRRSAQIYQDAGDGAACGQCPAACARHARRLRRAGSGTFRGRKSLRGGDRGEGARGNGFRGDCPGVSKPFRCGDRQRSGSPEGPHISHCPFGLFRFSGSVRDRRRTRTDLASPRFSGEARRRR